MAIPYADHNRIRLGAQSDWTTPISSWTTAHDLLVVPTGPPTVRKGVRKGDVMRLDGGSAPIGPGGPEPVEYALSGPVQGVSITSPAASPGAVPDSLLAQSAFGGARTSAYRTDIAEAGGGNTTTKIGVADIESPEVLPGDCLLIPLAAGGYGIGWVTAVTGGSPDEVEVTTLPGAPATTGTIFGARVAYLAVGGPPVELGAQWLGPDEDAAIRLVGGGVTRYQLDVTPGQEIRYEADTVWLYGEVNGSGPPLAETPIYPQIPDAIGANGARLRVGAESWCVERAVLTMESTMTPSRCHGATAGRAGMSSTSPVLVLEVDILVDEDHVDQPDPGSEPGLLQLDVSTTPGRALSIILRRPILQEGGEPVDLDGRLGRRLIYQSGPVVSTGDALERAPGAVGWL